MIEKDGVFKHGSEFFSHQIGLVQKMDNFFKLGLQVPEEYQNPILFDAIQQNGLRGDLIHI